MAHTIIGKLSKSSIIKEIQLLYSNKMSLIEATKIRILNSINVYIFFYNPLKMFNCHPNTHSRICNNLIITRIESNANIKINTHML